MNGGSISNRQMIHAQGPSRKGATNRYCKLNTTAKMARTDIR